MTHHFSCRVFYEDTDMAGIVYYANYLKFIERARSDWVKGLGIDQRRLKDDEGLVFAVRRVEADYLAPARLDDELTIATTVEQITPARLVMRQIVRCAGTLLFEAVVTIVMINDAGQPARLPARIRGLLN
ncbi:tol-pal system-associated acyl-CoA thioesterase [Primorskyibacter sp. S187A]|uniref:tol-pal system-associated acyl-CoA thioesterase n=1 Tax=Primorskyibacter sp. S187A TaxID=3415130 RepID=UPI003C7D7A8C